jgi:hypothetical protein
MKYLLFIFIFTNYLLSCTDLAPGSYPYAEIYKYKIDSGALIKALTTLKIIDSSLQIPEDVGLKDGKEGQNDYWYHFYFFDKKKNEIIHTWVRSEGNEITNFAFVGINKTLQLGNWKEINKDFNKEENNRKKEEFKHLILNRIEVPHYP